mmetsp:Transcript_42658/g.107310  ORF Transcript_42658/g.107310 Transcript_42658/m.107310 type:complete len:342 (-) Transcript_42658:65-1090(-)
MPTAIFKCWNFSSGTPPEPFARLARIFATASAETPNPNSPLAYKPISLLFKQPSLSLSYLANNWARFSKVLMALSLFTAFSCAVFVVTHVVMVSFKHSWTRDCNFNRSSLDSSRNFLTSSDWVARSVADVGSSAVRCWMMKSTQSLQAAFVSAPISRTAFSMACTPSASRPLPSPGATRGAAASLSRAEPCSALSTSPPSSPRSFLFSSCCSMRAFSSSSRRSSSRLRCSLMPSTRCRADSTCWLASSRIRSAKLPHFGSSCAKVSSTPFFSSSKFSGVANLMFWMAFLATNAACCSRRRRSSSSRFFLISSSFRRRISSSCLFCASCCCCCRSRSSSWRL